MAMSFKTWLAKTHPELVDDDGDAKDLPIVDNMGQAWYAGQYNNFDFRREEPEIYANAIR